MLADDLKSKFKDLDPRVIDRYLPMYENSYKCYYGANYGRNSCDDEIVLHLLAHLIFTADKQFDGTAVRQTASESVGSVSVSYATPTAPSTNEDMFFNSTIYGQTYLMLKSKNIGCYFV